MQSTDLESIVADFERAYASAPARVDIRDFVSKDDENYLEIATELIRVEIELRWETEHRKTLEDYRSHFPDVLQDKQSFDQIAFDEYRLRVDSGEEVTPSDYQAKYSIQAYHWPVQQKSSEHNEKKIKPHDASNDQPEFLDTSSLHGSLQNTHPDLAARIVSGQLSSTPTVENSLHRRLRYISLTILLTLLYLSFLSWMNPATKVGLFLGSSWLHWFNGLCLLVCGTICILLWTRHRIQLSHLRMLELVLFGSVLAELSSGLAVDLFVDEELTRPLNAVDHDHALFHYASSWSLPFFALIVAYGILVPSNWRRCTVIVSVIAIIPIVICAIAAIVLNAFTLSFFQSFFLQMVIWMVTAAAIAIYGVRRLEESRARLLKSGKLGKYQLIRKIASGGMGDVFLAEHTLMNRRCAIKLMHGKWSLDPDLLARFEREVQVLAGISHPKIVQIYDFGNTNEGIFYFVMEYLEGQNLKQLVEENGSMSPREVIEIASDVADALHVVHRGGIIHRDIKPSNILLSTSKSERNTKLLDFGLIKVDSRQHHNQITQDGAIIGTPAYMSPEQAAGREIDQRTDLYSLAAVAYFALTGQHIFERATTAETLTAHIVSPPPPIIETDNSIPSQLLEVLNRCLSKDPGCRFSTTAEFAEALRHIDV